MSDWKPGEEAINLSPISRRRGTRIWLVSVHEPSRIWTFAIRPGGIPIGVIDEEDLRRPAKLDPREPEAVASKAPDRQLNAENEHWAVDLYRSTVGAIRRMDVVSRSREMPIADAWFLLMTGRKPTPADRGDSAPHHDGQANTSGLVAEPEPRGEPPLERELAAWIKAESTSEWEAAVKASVTAGFKKWTETESAKAVVNNIPLIAESLAGRSRPDQPTMLDVAIGVVRWWLADPAHRRINISGQGHTLDAWTTRLGPEMKTAKTGWGMPDTAENAHRLIEEQHGITCPHAEVTVARNPAYTFAEDTGETD